MILLDSLYINNSGGKILLDYLIEELEKSKLDVFYLLDERCQGTFPQLSSKNTLYLKASLTNRKKFYLQHQNHFTKVLCFANLPPSIKLTATVYTYFHNLLIIKQPKGYPIISQLKFILKGLFIKWNRKNSDYYIVQSSNVRKGLISFLGINDAQCLTIPFYRHTPANKLFTEKKTEFIYISNGNPHKNHINLLKAWEILSLKMNINIPLHLTITNDYEKLISLIDQYKLNGIQIINHGKVDVKELYTNYKYSIYPSLIESFGLGLIESVDSNTEVIAADLPYVDAVIQAAEKFDPNSPQAIAFAVKKILEKNSSEFNSKRKTTNQIVQLISLISN